MDQNHQSSTTLDLSSNSSSPPFSRADLSLLLLSLSRSLLLRDLQSLRHNLRSIHSQNEIRADQICCDWDVHELRILSVPMASDRVIHQLMRRTFQSQATNISTSEITSLANGVIDTGQYCFQKGTTTTLPTLASLGNRHFDNWGESGMAADTSQQTDDTSTDVDTDDRNQLQGVHQHGALVSIDSVDTSNGKMGDQKSLRRLAQNREAARKSRLRKKAYVQQLENSQLKLNQLEQELRRAREQGIFIPSGGLGDQGHSTVGNGTLAFDLDLDYARWLDEHQRQINDLRTAVNSHVGDNERWQEQQQQQE